MNQAVRNASDGISLAQTAESALGELTNNLQRIREFAVQSANSTNSPRIAPLWTRKCSSAWRKSQRIASQTSFNGQKVLDGTFGTPTFQVGANVGETINVSLSQSVRTSQIGQIARLRRWWCIQRSLAIGQQGRVSWRPTRLTTKCGSNSAGHDRCSAAHRGAAAGQSIGSAYAKAAAINAASMQRASPRRPHDIEFTIWRRHDRHQRLRVSRLYSLAVNGQDVFAGFDATDGHGLRPQITDAINTQSATTGVTASLTGTAAAAERGRWTRHRHRANRGTGSTERYLRRLDGATTGQRHRVPRRHAGNTTFKAGGSSRRLRR